VVDGQVAANTFTQVSREVISRMATDTMADLLAATRHVAADVKRLVRRVASDQTLAKITTGSTAQQAAKRMATILREQKVAAVTYSNGARVAIDHYAELVVRTKTAIAYNRGVLDGAPEVELIEILDGPGCGLYGHNQGPTANGLVVPRRVAAEWPVAHPHCRRAFVPRPDATEASKGIRRAAAAIAAA